MPSFLHMIWSSFSSHKTYEQRHARTRGFPSTIEKPAFVVKELCSERYEKL